MTVALDLSHLIAAVLFGAVAVGWILHWLWCVIARATSSERERIASLVDQLDAAEQGREALAAELAHVQAAHLDKLAELERGITHITAEHGREADEKVDAALREADAARRDAADAWGALAEARQQVGELERALAVARKDA